MADPLWPHSHFYAGYVDKYTASKPGAQISRRVPDLPVHGCGRAYLAVQSELWVRAVWPVCRNAQQCGLPRVWSRAPTLPTGQCAVPPQRGGVGGAEQRCYRSGLAAALRYRVPCACPRHNRTSGVYKRRNQNINATRSSWAHPAVQSCRPAPGQP